MDETPIASTGATVGFELSLGLIGVAVAFAAGFWQPAEFLTLGMPYQADSVQDVTSALLWGTLGTLPMLGIIGLLYQIPLKSLQNLSTLMDQQLIPMFEGKSLTALAATAAAAGIGEEILFRWTIQTGFAEGLQLPYATFWGVIIASIVFGLMHWLTPAYAVIAGGISVYLGIQLLITESFWGVILTHSLYDFVILIYLVKFRAPRLNRTETN